MAATASPSDLIHHRLVNAVDHRVRDLCRHEPDAMTMANLLAAHIDVSRGFDLRYLAPGRSGCKVLLVTSTEDLPLVVKLGNSDAIRREYENYATFKVEEIIPAELRAELRPNLVAIGAYASLSYSWAGNLGNVQTFRTFFASNSARHLCDLLSSFIAAVFPWHRIRRGASLPFDQWLWEQSTIHAIKDALKDWTVDAKVQRTRKLLSVLETPTTWRDLLGARCCSQGVCHGDLNCHNILIASSPFGDIPKLIDFGSVKEGVSPAQDWAKLEREVKFRCLFDSIPDELAFARVLDEAEQTADQETLFPEDASRPAMKVAHVIGCLRREYIARASAVSDLAEVEYFYYLLAWTLAYLANDDMRRAGPHLRQAVLNSAYRTARRIDQLVEHPVVRAAFNELQRPVASVPTATAPAAQQLVDNFLSQISIAGHLEEADGTRRAIYLDDALYVHRAAAENQVISCFQEWKRSPQRGGLWLSIIGDAGHGKSCLLWYLFRVIASDPDCMVIPFHAQFLADSWKKGLHRRVLDAVHDSPPRRLLFLIDTLDLLVGDDDQRLAGVLNELRSANLLLITTSRKQEFHRLVGWVNPDRVVELGRYTEGEAQRAISNYIARSYPHWPEASQKRQFAGIWNLLEQQRQIRELDYEPLILRMMFEAYVPEDIPRDVNTQRVYQRFWDVRVRADRVASWSSRLGREKACYALARGLALQPVEFARGLALQPVEFYDREGEKVGLSLPVSDTLPFHEFVDALDADTARHVEDLLSGGVLAWANGNTAIRFFHQTFLEFTAARDILNRGPEEQERLIEGLAADVARFGLSRTPVLKQVAIQDYFNGGETWKAILLKLREVNNQLAAQLALEVIGKIEDQDYCLVVYREWVAADPRALQHIVCPTVAYYPAKRVRVALSLLQPFISSPRAIDIYTVCKGPLASLDASSVAAFLSSQVDAIEAGTDENKKVAIRDALCATAREGAESAFGDLQKLFRSLREGQRAGLLDNVRTQVLPRFPHQTAAFLEALSSEVLLLDSGEVWSAFLAALVTVPETGREIVQRMTEHLLQQGTWKNSSKAAVYIGKLVGRFILTSDLLAEYFRQIQSPDHAARMLATEVLYEAGDSHSEAIIDMILSTDLAGLTTQATCSLFRVVAGQSLAPGEKILAFLERAKWPESGIGGALRELFSSLARNSPQAAKMWILNGVRSRNDYFKLKSITAFSLVAREAIEAFGADDIRAIYATVGPRPQKLRELAASCIGPISKVDSVLAEELFRGFFDRQPREVQTAAITSLSYCVTARPEFVLDQGPAIIEAGKRENLGALHLYAEVLRRFPRGEGNSLLFALGEWFDAPWLRQVKDEKVLTDLLAVLKIYCDINPERSLAIADRCPVISKGVAGAMAALYRNLAEHSEDRKLLEQLLSRIPSVLPFPQVRTKHAILHALPTLDEKLGDRKVARMILSSYSQVKEPQALEALVKAALEVPNFTSDDILELVQDPNLPSDIRGLLLAARRRLG